MSLKFEKITEFPRGTLAALLKDGYSYEPKFARYWQKQWQEFDDFFTTTRKLPKNTGLLRF